jgi:hypothetical protein
LKKNNKIAMDFIWEGLPKLVREKVGKCSSSKELWDKLHDIYSSPIADLENAKEDADKNKKKDAHHVRQIQKRKSMMKQKLITKKI